MGIGYSRQKVRTEILCCCDMTYGVLSHTHTDLQLPLHQHEVLRLINTLNLRLEHYAVLLASLDPSIAIVAVDEDVPSDKKCGQMDQWNEGVNKPVCPPT